MARQRDAFPLGQALARSPSQVQSHRSVHTVDPFVFPPGMAASKERVALPGPVGRLFDQHGQRSDQLCFAHGANPAGAGTTPPPTGLGSHRTDAPAARAPPSGARTASPCARALAEGLDLTAFRERRNYGGPNGADSASPTTPRGFTTSTFRGGVIGAFSAGVSFGIVNAGGLENWQRVGLQATTGGIVESLSGGNFDYRLMSVGLTLSVMPQVGKIGNDVTRTAVGALVGGTLSVANGGRFANGALSGAIQGAMARNLSAAADPESMQAQLRQPGRTGGLTRPLHIVAMCQLLLISKPKLGLLRATLRSAA